RLEFSPVLPFGGDETVPLRGGALAWFLDRKAAAFVYGLRLHTVTLFVFRPDGLPWPTTGWERAGGREGYRAGARGFTVVLWGARACAAPPVALRRPGGGCWGPPGRRGRLAPPGTQKPLKGGPPGRPGGDRLSPAGPRRGPPPPPGGPRPRRKKRQKPRGAAP